MATGVAVSVPAGDSRFKILQAGFDGAVTGSVASAPGGPAAVMAKMVLELMPDIHESKREDGRKPYASHRPSIKRAPGREVQGMQEVMTGVVALFES